MNKLSVTELFELDTVWFKSLFESLEYPWHALPRLKDFIDGCSKTAFTEYSEGVFVGSNVTIHPYAVINSPCIISEGTEVRPFAFIRGGVIIGENCVIGNSTELKNCIIMNNVQLPHYNYVGDSVIGNNAHMGAGAICSNLKSNGTAVAVRGEESIDTNLRKLGAILGDGADIGCGCVLNPGTVIGRNSTVYPLNSVRGVIPPDSIVKSFGVISRKY